MLYEIDNLTLDAEANPRFAELSLSEIRRRDKNGWPRGRCIGGDKGDLYFDGYTVADGQTKLYQPALETNLELTEDEAHDIATEVLQASFASIGIETVEHA